MTRVSISDPDRHDPFTAVGLVPGRCLKILILLKNRALREAGAQRRYLYRNVPEEPFRRIDEALISLRRLGRLGQP